MHRKRKALLEVLKFFKDIFLQKPNIAIHQLSLQWRTKKLINLILFNKIFRTILISNQEIKTDFSNTKKQLVLYNFRSLLIHSLWKKSQVYQRIISNLTYRALLKIKSLLKQIKSFKFNQQQLILTVLKDLKINKRFKKYTELTKLQKYKIKITILKKF